MAALGAQGWEVASAASRDEALTFYAGRSPDLVLVEEQLAGAEDLVALFCRRSGGPGVVLVRHKGLESDLPEGFHKVDAMVRDTGPVQELVETVREWLSQDPAHRTLTAPAGGDRIYTAHEIFGDLLVELSEPARERPGPGQAEAGPGGGTPAAPAFTPIAEEPWAEPSRAAVEEPARQAPAARAAPAEREKPTASARSQDLPEGPDIEAQVDGLLTGILTESRAGVDRALPPRAEIGAASQRVDTLLALALEERPAPAEPRAGRVEAATGGLGGSPRVSTPAEPGGKPAAGAVGKVVSLWRSWTTRGESPSAASHDRETDTETLLSDLFGGGDGAEQ